MIADVLRTAGVAVRLKSDSHLMRFLAFFMGQWFLRNAWTTIGKSKIWAPVGTDLSSLERYAPIILHEMVHCGQARRWPVLWQFSYLLLPLPIGLAWCRWRWEREAYLVQLRAGTRTVDSIVDTLWTRYLFPWPRGLMRRYFQKALAKEPKQ